MYRWHHFVAYGFQHRTDKRLSDQRSFCISYCHAGYQYESGAMDFHNQIASSLKQIRRKGNPRSYLNMNTLRIPMIFLGPCAHYITNWRWHTNPRSIRILVTWCFHFVYICSMKIWKHFGFTVLRFCNIDLCRFFGFSFDHLFRLFHGDPPVKGKR